MSEKFNLKWNDFQNNVSKSFGLLRHETYLHDVTLVSDDYKHISAHKLVLSACSDYFKNIFKETKQTQPVLCLDKVSSTDLHNILDYVYDGEVKIYQEDLDQFLDVAQRLKIQGLISNSEETDESAIKPQSVINEEEVKITDIETLDNQTTKKNKYQPRRAYTNQSRALCDSKFVNEDGETMSREEHLERLNNNVTDNEDGSASCNVCGKRFSGTGGNARKNARRHVEIHIEGLVYSCTLCDKTFRSVNNLNAHKYKKKCNL